MTGPPACGKTELGRQYAEDVEQQWKKQNSRPHMIGVLKAGSVKEFDTSLQKLAQHIGCPRAVDVAVNITDVTRRLKTLADNIKHRMKTFKKWLLVIDNLTRSTDKLLSGYWPEPGSDDWQKGMILVTTSDRSVVPRGNPKVDEIRLSYGLTPSESVDLLRCISKCENEDGARQLAAELDYNPLSLASAGLYVRETRQTDGRQMSWREYIDRLSKNIQAETEEYLAEKNKTYPHTLRTAIWAALKKMTESNERLKFALQMISVCCQQHSLPVSAVLVFIENCSGSSSQVDKLTMRNCSLILFSRVDNIHVHASTHDALRQMWESNLDKNSWELAALKALVAESKRVENDYDRKHARSVQLLLLPHMLHILQQPSCSGTNQEVIAEAWMLCSSGIDALGGPCKVGQWSDTGNMLCQQKKCLEAALRLYKCVPPLQKEQLVECYLQLADVFDGMYQQDEALCNAELAVKEATLAGETCKHVRAKSMKKLASICIDKGNIDRAIHLFEESKNIYVDLCGYESIYVASVLTSLGRAYHDIGQNDHSKRLYEESMKICAHVTETEGLMFTSLLAQTFASLGRAYLEPGYVDTEKALQCLQQSLRVRRHIYGHDHPISAMTLTAIGRAYLVNQQPLVAELQLREALRIQQLTLPENHSDKAITLNVLGNVERQRGNLQEAVFLLRHSLEIRTAVFNSDHQDIGYCKNDLAMALLRSGRADCAIPLLQDALRIKCQKFGNHHIEVAITCGCLAEAYKTIGDCKQSKTYLDNRAEIMNQQTDTWLLLEIESYYNL